MVRFAGEKSTFRRSLKSKYHRPFPTAWLGDAQVKFPWLLERRDYLRVDNPLATRKRYAV
jgi:hypothetical protein